MKNDWDLSSIVRSCKTSTFTNPSTIFEIPPENLTTTIPPTANSTIFPVNTTQSCFEDLIINQENSSVANTHTMENDWDLSAIVRSCKVTTFPNRYTFCETPQNLTTMVTTTTTNSLVSPINTTLSCFADFTFNQENSSVSFASHKPSDFADLNNLRGNFNSTIHIPTPTTTSILIIFTTTASSPTTTIFSTHISPNNITNINTNVHASDQNYTSFNFSTSIKQYQMQPNELTEKYNFITKFNPTTSIPTPDTIIPTSATYPTTNNHTTTIPITAATMFTNPTITINPHTTTPTHSRQQKPHSRIRKNKNLATSVCHMKEENLSEDPWQWRKYGRKPIKGSPHSRSYYKCSIFDNCPARKHVEKRETEDNIYVVTYRGKHNHGKTEVKQNSVNGTSRDKSSEAILPVVRQDGASQNIESLASPNVAMVQFDQSKSNNVQVFDGHSKITNLETELVVSQSHVVGEVGSFHNVQKVDSHNKMILQRDEPERSNAQIFPRELEISYLETNLIGSSNADDGILIPNMSTMSQDMLLDFNRLSGSVLP